MQELADAMLKDVQRSPDSPEVGIAHQVFSITSWFAGDYLSARAHLEQAVSAYSYERDHHLAARFGFDFGVLACSSSYAFCGGFGTWTERCTWPNKV